MEGLDIEAINGFIIGLVMVIMMIAPIYCCQISNEEYNKIIAKIKH
jgi:hypothetical protein